MAELGLNKDQTINKATSDEINNIYLQNTEMAKNKGIFGSPTFVYENERGTIDVRMP